MPSFVDTSRASLCIHVTDHGSAKFIYLRLVPMHIKGPSVSVLSHNSYFLGLKIHLFLAIFFSLSDLSFKLGEWLYWEGNNYISPLILYFPY